MNKIALQFLLFVSSRSRCLAEFKYIPQTTSILTTCFHGENEKFGHLYEDLPTQTHLSESVLVPFVQIFLVKVVIFFRAWKMANEDLVRNTHIPEAELQCVYFNESKKMCEIE